MTQSEKISALATRVGSEFKKYLKADGTAKRSFAIPLVVPNETASTATLTATVAGITELYDGLTIAIRMPFANVASSKLNVNGLGAKPIYYQATTTSAGRIPANTVVILVYETVTASGGCWKIAYAYQSDNTARQYQTTANVNYPILTRYNTTDKGTGYDTTYARYAMAVTLNPSTGTITAANFSGLASKATADASGNNIAETYATKAAVEEIMASFSNEDEDYGDVTGEPSDVDYGSI